MQIEVEFIGFPTVYDIFPEGRHRVTFEGKKIRDLIEDLIAQKGGRLKEALLEPGTDRLDPTIQVCIDKRFLARDEISDVSIGEGNCITFLRLLAGG